MNGCLCSIVKRLLGDMKRFDGQPDITNDDINEQIGVSESHVGCKSTWSAEIAMRGYIGSQKGWRQIATFCDQT